MAHEPIVDADAFWRDGFTTVVPLVDDTEVEALRRAYDEILDADVVTDRQLGGITRQVMVPSMSHPAFESNAALDAGRRVMRDLFPAAATFNRTYDMLIDKPPGHPHETPWHQDAGYFQTPVAPAGFTLPLTSVQFWVALDDADTANGCMQFVPGAHRSPLAPHRVVSGDAADEGRLIGYEDAADTGSERAVPCAIPAGSATIHTALTPHFTGANTSVRPRRAYIFNLVAADRDDTTLEAHLREQYVRNISSSPLRTRR